ncbi:mitochondrial carrier domain-containing protein [Lasiosphaeria ovina]|uniref:Mitochondrial carrier domain-containing protein n=1 Tax=Lasiosphaeria ovina TaxID=92902 RepID=A0AAE0JVD4_9PEZI|nr:mitochondrial carrier domain-containing protein [Lasiosphaeria ovina]
MSLPAMAAAPPKPAARHTAPTSRAQPWVHLVAGASGGVATSIIAAPHDVFRRRLQSDYYRTPSRQCILAAEHGGAGVSSPRRLLLGAPFRHAAETFGILGSIKAREGRRGLFRGLGPSIAGVAPATAVKFYLVKTRLQLDQSRAKEEGGGGAAGAAKVAAVLMTYPHKVVRTRLRLAPSADGSPRHVGLVQCFKSVWSCEGWRGLYGGLTPYLMRSIPATVIALRVYELVLRLAGT